MSRRTLLQFTLLLTALSLHGGSAPAGESRWDASARAGLAMLVKLCDDYGGRLVGSRQNMRALERLAEELAALGLKPEYQWFSMPGWERRSDSVTLLNPFKRSLRVAALSYTNPTSPFDADVVDIGNGAAYEYPAGSSGKVGLLSAGTPLQAREIVSIASQRGLRAILFINRENGGQLLTRTGSAVGEALPLPVFTITQEEGLWIGRLLARKQPVRVRVEATSRCVNVKTANLVVRLEGRTADKVIVGAHFDSWDLGQGAIDNGLGIAQVYALAHALKGLPLARTVELVWFNGEEMALWGSRHAAKQLGDDPVIAMVNLDMVGVPIGINALGDDSLVPALERFQNNRARKLPKGVENVNWLGSDHTPYQLAGVRAVTFNAPIDRESVRYYHDFADTIDKLPEKVVVESTEIITDAVLALVNDTELKPFRRASEDTEALFTRFGLERRMKGSGTWNFP
ncbi:MAG: M28 family peptidase [Opitutaceae bacterium]|nr:M28 family peptidase [Opitutaceae bacterium]